MDSFQKRQRERKKIEKRAEKEARRRERAEFPNAEPFEPVNDAAPPGAASIETAVLPPAATSTPSAETQRKQP
ncbi:MAG: hypothetical protein IT453_20230 [Planctomycetes bacterium]|nr:hypothetical protein [Planctomycetota bacterium]